MLSRASYLFYVSVSGLYSIVTRGGGHTGAGCGAAGHLWAGLSLLPGRRPLQLVRHSQSHRHVVAVASRRKWPSRNSCFGTRRQKWRLSQLTACKYTVGCGLVQAHYSFKNISTKSLTTVREGHLQAVKLLTSTVWF